MSEMNEQLRSAEDVAREVLIPRRDCESEHIDADLAIEIVRAYVIIHDYAAEVREAARAEALAGFRVETRVTSPSGICHDANGHVWTYPATHERRLVGPWEPIDNS